jgi:hypothetical protein
MHVLDISDLSQPKLVTSFETPSFYSVPHCAEGGDVKAAAKAEGLAVVP